MSKVKVSGRDQGSWITLASWVHASKDPAKLFSLGTPGGGELPAPLEDEQEGSLTGSF